MYGLVCLNKGENGVATVTLCRESKANALNEELVTDLYTVLQEIQSDTEVKAVILKGGKKFFSAGVDVNMVAGESYESTLGNNFMDERWTFLERMTIPVIAAVEGVAFGGGFELALMCDAIIAGTDAVFAFPEVDLGLMPGLGGTRKLFDLIGSQKAFIAISTGRRIDADEAESLGIVAWVSEDPYGDAVSLASEIVVKPPEASRSIKRMFSTIKNGLYSRDLVLERQMFTALFSTTSSREKITKFLGR